MSGGDWYRGAGCWDLPKVSPASHQPPLQCANPCNYCPNSGDSRHCGQQTRCKMHNTHGQLLANIIVFVLYLFIRTDYFVSRIPCISISMVPLKLRALFIVSFFEVHTLQYSPAEREQFLDTFCYSDSGLWHTLTGITLKLH